MMLKVVLCNIDSCSQVIIVYRIIKIVSRKVKLCHVNLSGIVINIPYL